MKALAAIATAARRHAWLPPALLAALAFLPARDDAPMLAAARALVAGLGPELAARASFSLDSDARLDWHYVPRLRVGVSLAQLDAPQRELVDALLASALSEQGLRKVRGVRALERVLRELALARGERAEHRDSDLYWIAFFGAPGDTQPWAWRFEGHHLSLSFTLVGGELVGATPCFFGASPARVASGSDAGLRVLGAEEDLARELVSSLDESALAAALIPGDPPADVQLAPGAAPARLEPFGLPAARMDQRQRALLVRLLGEYAHNLSDDAASERIARVLGERASLDSVGFAWAGGTRAGEPHYYRIQGQSFVIEYDNVQGGADHVHALWRDPDDDFGARLLAEHRREDHTPR